MVHFFTKNSANFKALLFVIGVLIFGGTFWYTQQVVNTLKEKTTEFLYFKIKLFEANINDPNSNVDLSFFFNEIIINADYPIIWTDSEHTPQSWLNISAVIDTSTSLSTLDSLLLRNTMLEMNAENKPIAINYQGTVLGYYYYGFPPEVQKIKNLPLFTFFIGALFVLFGYLGFTYIKSSEERNIWVGMAKETAHQLGTPLSSISGWLELIEVDSNQKDRAFIEIANDLRRLKKIANRFSKIGSVPILKKENLSMVIQEVILYFENRLPNLEKKIRINFIESEINFAYLNTDLFEWVLENLIKNAIDSIGKDDGVITVSIQNTLYHSLTTIDVSDNGKGIPLPQKKNIFKPGYSTKKRGWGLGLSLAKRIIEEYHGGKLFLFESKVQSGSTFRINLKTIK